MAPRRKVLKIALIIFLIFTAAFFFYFPSFSRYRELKSEAERLQKQLDQLQKQIIELQHEKQLLKNDKNYLEAVIRKELGLVEPGEVVYEFEKKPSRRVASVQPVQTTAKIQAKNAPQASATE